MADRERITLGDDGTMDTVLVCTACREEFRFNYHDVADLESDEDNRTDEQRYEDFVAWAIDDAESEHDCPTWDRSGCQEQVCSCHDETATPYPCSGCGCQPRAEVTR